MVKRPLGRAAPSQGRGAETTEREKGDACSMRLITMADSLVMLARWVHAHEIRELRRRYTNQGRMRRITSHCYVAQHPGARATQIASRRISARERISLHAATS